MKIVLPDQANQENQISIIGSSQANQQEKSDALKVGKLLGNHDATLICGGRGGVMKYSCKGIQESQKGLAIGILPGSDESKGNQFLDVRITTGIGNARNIAVVLSGEAIIAIGGGHGTLSELAYSFKYGKSIFGVDSWNHPEFDYIHNLSPEEAVKRALESTK